MREIQKYRYAVAGVLVIVVFTLGVFFSNFVDGWRSKKLKTELEEDIIGIESRQLQLNYLKSNDVKSCDVLKAGLNSIVSSYNKRLGKVQRFKQETFFHSDKFQNIKRRYILSGIRYWMFAEDLRERCKYSPETILFFTENLEKSNCNECQKLGEQLSLIKKTHGKEVLIFSIPTTMNDGLVEILKKQYNVTSTPAIVINGEIKMAGYQNRNNIERKLNLTEK